MGFKKEFVVLYVEFLDSIKNDPTLFQLYNERIVKHNEGVDSLYPDSGFDLLVPNSSIVVVELMGLIAVVSTLYVVCRCMSAPDLSKIALIEIFTLFCASVALPPIPYFTLYFCLLHSPLHLHESLSKLGFSQVIVFALFNGVCIFFFLHLYG